MTRSTHALPVSGSVHCSTSFAEPFFAMVRKNAERYSLSTARYSTNAFFRRRLGHQFSAAKLNHALYENFTEARAAVR